jgi:DnaJ-class molecular chaperone
MEHSSYQKAVVASQLFGTTVNSHYEALEVSRFANAADVKAAYRNIALVLHPDKVQQRRAAAAAATAGDEDTLELSRTAAADKWDKVKEAYGTLSNEGTRTAYDTALDGMLASLDLNHKHQGEEGDENGIAKNNGGNNPTAVIVLLEEMEAEVCDVIIDNLLHDDDASSYDINDISESFAATGGATKTDTVYTYGCRCGETFEIFGEDLPIGKGKRKVIECLGCGLSITVEV